MWALLYVEKMLKKNYLDKIYSTLEKKYELVPLEIFADNAYKSLISTLMSARTNDDTTVVASKRLFKVAQNIRSLNKLSEDQIAKLIFPVGFYKTKAKHIKQLTKKVLSDFEGNIPNTREELMSLPGVGRKTANLVLNRAFGKPAIAVDTHVHKITNMLGWVNTKNPEETELALMKVLPKQYWSDTNRLFVSIGRQFRSKAKLKDFLMPLVLSSQDHPN